MDDTVRDATGASPSSSPTTTSSCARGCARCIDRHADLRVVGRGRRLRRDGRGRERAEPQVLVTDIRMPPSFNREGIDAAKEVRRRHPGTGVVILSQYDDPEYAVSLLAEGSAGYGYLLKDHIAEGDQLIDAIRAVATGGTALDPAIVEALVRPVAAGGRPLAPPRRSCSAWWPRASPSRPSPPPGARPRGGRRRGRGAVREAGPGGERREPGGACTGCACCTRPSSTARSRARRCRACSRAGWPRSSERRGAASARPSGLEVTVLMSDIRSYSTIAEHADPSQLAGQLNAHRAAMNRAIIGEGGDGHAVRRRRGDGRLRRAAAPGRPRRRAPWRPRAPCTRARDEINDQWRAEGLPGVRPRASASRPAWSRPRCSAPRSASSTRWSATP